MRSKDKPVHFMDQACISLGKNSLENLEEDAEDSSYSSMDEEGESETESAEAS